MRKRLKWLVPLLLVVLIDSLLPVRWLTTPDHTVGQIIITSQNIAQPVITNQEYAVTQPGYRASLYDTVWPVERMIHKIKDDGDKRSLRSCKAPA